MGQIGGYTGLLWMIMTFFFDGYESFRFTNALIGSVYTCTPEGPDATPPESEEESRKKIQETISGSKTDGSVSWYSYRELLITWFMRKLCCCCKAKHWYEHRMRRYEIWLAA